MLYEEPRPAVSGRAVGLELGDTVAELISPLGVGVIERYLARYGDGIRSTVFAVDDLDRAQQFFVERGIVLYPGDAPDSFAVAPKDNLGLLFEFSQ